MMTPIASLEGTDNVSFWIEVEEVIAQSRVWLHNEETRRPDVDLAFAAWRHARNESVDRTYMDTLANTFINRSYR